MANGRHEQSSGASGVRRLRCNRRRRGPGRPDASDRSGPAGDQVPPDRTQPDYRNTPRWIVPTRGRWSFIEESELSIGCARWDIHPKFRWMSSSSRGFAIRRWRSCAACASEASEPEARRSLGTRSQEQAPVGDGGCADLAVRHGLAIHDGCRGGSIRDAHAGSVQRRSAGRTPRHISARKACCCFPLRNSPIFWIGRSMHNRSSANSWPTPPREVCLPLWDCLARG